MRAGQHRHDAHRDALISLYTCVDPDKVAKANKVHTDSITPLTLSIRDRWIIFYSNTEAVRMTYGPY